MALLLLGPVMAKYIVAVAHTVHLRVDRKQREGTRNTPLEHTIINNLPLLGTDPQTHKHLGSIPDQKYSNLYDLCLQNLEPEQTRDWIWGCV